MYFKLNQELFEKAIQNESFRPVFIKKIDLELAKSYFKEVFYFPMKTHAYMSTHISKLMYYFEIPFLKSYISIWKGSFEKESSHQTIDDFESSLIDHEGFHAFTNFNYPKQTGFTLLNKARLYNSHKSKYWNRLEQLKPRLRHEVETYLFQMKNFSNRDISEKYAKTILRCVESHQIWIEHIEVAQHIRREKEVWEEIKRKLPHLI